MGICIGIGNYIGNKKLVSINKDPQNSFSNLLGSNILTESGVLILREIDYNIITENEESIKTEDGKYILRDLGNISSEDGKIIITQDNFIILFE